MSKPRIPLAVDHDDFIKALTPLCDLLGTSPHEIAGDIHILNRNDGDVVCELKFRVAAGPEARVEMGEHPQGHSFGEATHEIRVVTI